MPGVPFISYGKPHTMGVGATFDWGVTGTGTVTAGQADPFGGTDAYLLSDTGADFFGVTNAALWATIDYVGPHLIPFWIKEGTAGVTQVVQIRTVTPNVQVGQVTVDWAGGVPTFAGSGTKIGPWQYGTSGWWFFLWGTPTLQREAHKVTIHPAAASTAQQGNATFYWQPALVALHGIDVMRAAPRPMEGSEWNRSAGGIDVAWITGTEYRVRLMWPWMGTTDVVGLNLYGSGWDGPMGMQAFLEKAWEQKGAHFHPVIETPGINFPVRLESPADGFESAVSEADDTARLPLVLYGTTKMTGLGTALSA